MAYLTTTEKIRLIVQRNNLTLGLLAERTGQTRQNLSNKLGAVTSRSRNCAA